LQGTSQKIKKEFLIQGIKQIPVHLTKAELEAFYYGFCNDTLWPLYHDSIRVPSFRRHWWWPYREVNQRFAKCSLSAIESSQGTNNLVWVHDYQLQLVPKMIRSQNSSAKIGFFLHIPFPPVELFAHLPWRKEILNGILGSNLIGFQTKRSVRNFIDSAERFTNYRYQKNCLTDGKRKVKIKSFPITVDVNRYTEASKKPSVLTKIRHIREKIANGRKIILGVDRLDYTKGIDFRLKAIETLLRDRRISINDFLFIQIVIPSRENVPSYLTLKNDIEQMVGHLNGEYSEAGLVPIQYLHRSLNFEDLLAYYAVTDLMLVTPLRDGMNLVAKEYICTRHQNTGALILSEFAGAAEELKAAFLVNPFDVDGLSNCIEKCLKISKNEEQKRMKNLREIVKSRNVHDWANSFLEELDS